VAVVEILPGAEALPTAAGARLSWPDKVLYGIGEATNGSRLVLFGLFLLFFYTSVMGLPGTLVGIAEALGLACDAVVDPFIGHLSDRARLAWLGRRHSFMLIGALTQGLAFWLLFSPPRGLSTPALFGWLLVTLFLQRVANSTFAVPYYALGAELSADYHERSSIAGIRGACGLLGVLPASVSLALFFPNTQAGVDPKLVYGGYPLMGLAMGGLMSLAALVSTLGTLRLRSRLAAAPTPAHAARLSLLYAFRVAFQNPPFLAVFASFSLVYLGTVVNSALLIHFATYYVQLTQSSDISRLQVVFYVGAIAGVLLWLRLSRRLEKRTIYLSATLVTAALLITAFVLVGPGHPLGTANAQPLVVGELVAGIFASVFWFLPLSMIADATDQDELRTGQRRDGIFVGLFNFGTKLGAGLSVLLTGILIDVFAGLVPGQAMQSPETTQRIGMLFSLLPAALLLLGAAAIWRYPLGRAAVRSIQVRLADQQAPGNQSA
jgi:glycoside/pentoside/hexuronide:cation symporter, GPH family